MRAILRTGFGGPEVLVIREPLGVRPIEPLGVSRSGSDRFRSFCGKTSKSV